MSKVHLSTLFDGLIYIPNFNFWIGFIVWSVRVFLLKSFCFPVCVLGCLFLLCVWLSKSFAWWNWGAFFLVVKTNSVHLQPWITLKGTDAQDLLWVWDGLLRLAEYPCYFTAGEAGRERHIVQVTASDLELYLYLVFYKPLNVFLSC